MVGAVELNVGPLEEDLWGVTGTANGADNELVEDGQGDGCGSVGAEVKTARVVVVGNDIGVWSNL